MDPREKIGSFFSETVLNAADEICNFASEVAHKNSLVLNDVITAVVWYMLSDKNCQGSKTGTRIESKQVSEINHDETKCVVQLSDKDEQSSESRTRNLSQESERLKEVHAKSNAENVGSKNKYSEIDSVAENCNVNVLEEEEDNEYKSISSNDKDISESKQDRVVSTTDNDAVAAEVVSEVHRYILNQAAGENETETTDYFDMDCDEINESDNENSGDEELVEEVTKTQESDSEIVEEHDITVISDDDDVDNEQNLGNTSAKDQQNNQTKEKDSGLEKHSIHTSTDKEQCTGDRSTSSVNQTKCVDNKSSAVKQEMPEDEKDVSNKTGSKRKLDIKQDISTVDPKTNEDLDQLMSSQVVIEVDKTVASHKSSSERADSSAASAAENQEPSSSKPATKSDTAQLTHTLEDGEGLDTSSGGENQGILNEPTLSQSLDTGPSGDPDAAMTEEDSCPKKKRRLLDHDKKWHCQPKYSADQDKYLARPGGIEGNSVKLVAKSLQQARDESRSPGKYMAISQLTTVSGTKNKDADYDTDSTCVKSDDSLDRKNRNDSANSDSDVNVSGFQRDGDLNKDSSSRPTRRQSRRLTKQTKSANMAQALLRGLNLTKSKTLPVFKGKRRVGRPRKYETKVESPSRRTCEETNQGNDTSGDSPSDVIILD